MGASATFMVAPQSALVEQSFDVPSAVAKRGETLFALNCAVCHGDGALSGGVAPDLRNSSLVPQITSFSSIVSRVLLATRGMPMFNELTSLDLNALQAYLLSDGSWRGQIHLPGAWTMNSSNNNG